MNLTSQQPVKARTSQAAKQAKAVVFQVSRIRPPNTPMSKQSLEKEPAYLWNSGFQYTVFLSCCCCYKDKLSPWCLPSRGVAPAFYDVEAKYFPQRSHLKEETRLQSRRPEKYSSFQDILLRGKWFLQIYLDKNTDGNWGPSQESSPFLWWATSQWCSEGHSWQHSVNGAWQSNNRDVVLVGPVWCQGSNLGPFSKALALSCLPKSWSNSFHTFRALYVMSLMGITASETSKRCSGSRILGKLQEEIPDLIIHEIIQKICCTEK